MGSKKPSKRVVQFLFTSRHTVPTSIPSSNYSPNLRRSCVKLPHILSRMPHSPSGASARPSPHVSIKSLELNALHTSQIQDMVHLNGNRSSRLQAQCSRHGFESPTKMAGSTESGPASNHGLPRLPQQWIVFGVPTKWPHWAALLRTRRQRLRGRRRRAAAKGDEVALSDQISHPILPAPGAW